MTKKRKKRKEKELQNERKDTTKSNNGPGVELYGEIGGARDVDPFLHHGRILVGGVVGRLCADRHQIDLLHEAARHQGDGHEALGHAVSYHAAHYLVAQKYIVAHLFNE